MSATTTTVDVPSPEKLERADFYLSMAASGFDHIAGQLDLLADDLATKERGPEPLSVEEAGRLLLFALSAERMAAGVAADARRVLDLVWSLAHDEEPAYPAWAGRRAEDLRSVALELEASARD
jgi:hypothetical protein